MKKVKTALFLAGMFVMCYVLPVLANEGGGP